MLHLRTCGLIKGSWLTSVSPRHSFTSWAAHATPTRYTSGPKARLMANDYKKRRPLFVAPEGVNYEGKTCAGLSVLTSSKFDSVVHALNLPHLAVVVKRVPASGLTIKPPFANLRANEHQISDRIPQQNRGRRAQRRAFKISKKVRWTASPLGRIPRQINFEALQVA